MSASTRPRGAELASTPLGETDHRQTRSEELFLNGFSLEILNENDPARSGSTGNASFRMEPCHSRSLPNLFCLFWLVLSVHANRYELCSRPKLRYSRSLDILAHPPNGLLDCRAHSWSKQARWSSPEAAAATKRLIGSYSFACWCSPLLPSGSGPRSTASAPITSPSTSGSGCLSGSALLAR